MLPRDPYQPLRTLGRTAAGRATATVAADQHAATGIALAMECVEAAGDLLTATEAYFDALARRARGRRRGADGMHRMALDMWQTTWRVRYASALPLLDDGAS
jgi:hypothetical protein